MKTRNVQIGGTALLVLVILTGPFSKLRAEDLRIIHNLSGYWKFSIGDNEEWIDPEFDDSDWDEIHVPDSWEKEGYDDYNGYAWYRKRFRITNFPHNQQLYLVLGKIDDCDEVYFNGKLIGKTGSFPPYFLTAYNQKRKYPIPREIINPDGYNQIVVRVYDSYVNGGIVYGKVGICVDEDTKYLKLDLAGTWKFKTGNNFSWRSENYDDEDWNDIFVPATWELQGYETYDGYAWYRKEFRISFSPPGEALYLSLGKIDDYDVVYLNGKEIGEVFDLEKDGEYRRRGGEYNARRIYEIPKGILSRNGTNTIAIQVYDHHGLGGVYEGPVGIMDKDNYMDYKRKYHKNRGFWDYIFDAFSN
ncbi:MAG: beta galactosidase jelly roll domain-containing protein [Cytophagales bacterium]|nr:beta galactosidase jelly roll domain-containing protein [Cytophagales bacterium]